MLRSFMLVALLGFLSLVSVHCDNQLVILPPSCSRASCTSTTSPRWTVDTDSRCDSTANVACISIATPTGTTSSALTGIDRPALRYATNQGNDKFRNQLLSDVFGTGQNYGINQLTRFQFSVLRETPYTVGGGTSTDAQSTLVNQDGNLQFPVLRLLLVTPVGHPAGDNKLLELILEPVYQFQMTQTGAASPSGYPAINTWTAIDFTTSVSLRVYSSTSSFGAGNSGGNSGRTMAANCAGSGTDTFGTLAQWTAPNKCLAGTRIYGINVGFGSLAPQIYPRTIITYVDAVSLGLSAVGITNRRLLQAAQDITFDFTDTAATTPPTSGAFGDPQLVGFHGQSYQVHGIDGSIYNLISSSDLQVNAEFKFLSEGNCPTLEQAGPSSANTNCFSHPGSYLGAIGVLQRIGNLTHTVEAFAGEASHGFRSVSVDGEKINIGQLFNFDDSESSESSDSLVTLTRQTVANRFEVSWPHSHLLVIKTPEFDMEFDNSDGFVNQRVMVNKPLNQLKSHGLIGQTWQNKKYKGSIKDIEGEVDDYTIDDNSLLGTDFIYNQFQY